MYNIPASVFTEMTILLFKSGLTLLSLDIPIIDKCDENATK